MRGEDVNWKGERTVDSNSLQDAIRTGKKKISNEEERKLQEEEEEKEEERKKG